MDRLHSNSKEYQLRVIKQRGESFSQFLKNTRRKLVINRYKQCRIYSHNVTLIGQFVQLFDDKVEKLKDLTENTTNLERILLRLDLENLITQLKDLCNFSSRYEEALNRMQLVLEKTKSLH